jgi:hypothetical protein
MDIFNTLCSTASNDSTRWMVRQLEQAGLTTVEITEVYSYVITVSTTYFMSSQ